MPSTTTRALARHPRVRSAPDSGRGRSVAAALLIGLVAVTLLGAAPAGAGQYPPDPEQAGETPRSAAPLTPEVFDAATRLLGIDPIAHPMSTLVQQRATTNQRAASLAAQAAGRSTPVLQVGGELVEPGETIVAAVEPGEPMSLGVCCVAPNTVVRFDLERIKSDGTTPAGSDGTLGVALTTADGAAILDFETPDVEPGRYRVVARTSDGEQVSDLAATLEVPGSASSTSFPTVLLAIVLLAVGVVALVIGARRQPAEAT